MYISREIDYAFRIMIALAIRDGTFMTREELGKGHCIPHNFLSLILPKLVRSGLLKHEPKEGYATARVAIDIGLLEIVESAHGPIDLMPMNPEHRRQARSLKSLSSLWSELQKKIEACLSGKRLSELIVEE